MPLTYRQDFSRGLFGKYSAIVDCLPPTASILEVGCHAGDFSICLMERGHRVLGIEMDPEAARLAQTVGVPVVIGDIEHPSVLAKISEVFDVILLADVLEHLRDPVSVLQQLKAILKPMGMLVVTGPNVAYWSIRKDLLLGRWDYVEAGVLDETHLHFYTEKGWLKLFSDSGYRVKYLRGAEGGFPLERIFRSILFFWRVAVTTASTLVVRLFPTLFAWSFIIVAVPDSRPVPYDPKHPRARQGL